MELNRIYNIDCIEGMKAIAAKQLKRNFIAFEKNKDFFESSVKRYNEETAQMSLF